MSFWLARTTGRLMALIYNRLFFANATFRKYAHQSRGFRIPSYKSFFVMQDVKPDGGSQDMTSVAPFPKDIVEVVKVTELHKIAWEVWNKAHEL